MGALSSEAHAELYRDFDESYVPPPESESQSNPVTDKEPVPMTSSAVNTVPSPSHGALAQTTSVNAEPVVQVVEAKVAAMSIKDKIAAIKARTEAINAKKEANAAAVSAALSPPAEE